MSDCELVCPRIIIIIIIRDLYSAIMPLGGYRGAESSSYATIMWCVSAWYATTTMASTSSPGISRQVNVLAVS